MKPIPNKVEQARLSIRLRKEVGLGVVSCNKYLEQNGWDFELAKEDIKINHKDTK